MRREGVLNLTPQFVPLLAFIVFLSYSARFTRGEFYAFQ